MLSLERQERYRLRYRLLRPDWLPSTERYERLVHCYATRPQATAPRHMRVLDVGCGAGGALERLSRCVALAAGVDADIASLQRHRDRRVRLSCAAIDQLPFRDASFDLVISSWVLEHLTQPASAFAEIARVLRPGGHFVFLTPNARNLVTLLNRSIPSLAQRRLVRAFYGRDEHDTFPVCYQSNSVAALQRLARQAGLRCVRLETISDPTYLAFNDALFFLSVLVERCTPAEHFVHLLGDFVKD